MAEIAQLGTSLAVGFGSNVYTGYIMEEFTKESSGEQIAVRDQDNATCTILVCDLGSRISFSALISSGSLTPPAQGATVTINSVNYRCESASVKQSRTASILNFTGIKEDSMTYT